MGKVWHYTLHYAQCIPFRELHNIPHSPEEGHRSPKVLGKYYSYSTGVFAHGYLRASTSETHAQVSETARTGAAAGHSGESGRERRHAPLRGALPLRGHHPTCTGQLFHLENIYITLVQEDQWHGVVQTGEKIEIERDWKREKPQGADLPP